MMEYLPVSTPEFYVLEFDVPFAEVTSVEYSHWVCPKCGKYRGDRVGHTALKFHKKAELADIVPTAMGLCCRKHVFDVLFEERISGWREGRVDVAIPSRLASLPHAYSELVVLGQAVNWEGNAGIHVNFRCDYCGRTQLRRPEHGMPMPAASWDKSDVFRIREFGYVLVTDRLRDLALQYQWSGIVLTPIEEWHDPLYMVSR